MSVYRTLVDWCLPETKNTRLSAMQQQINEFWCLISYSENNYIRFIIYHGISKSKYRTKMLTWPVCLVNTKGRLKMQGPKLTDQKRTDWKCQTWKWRTKSQGMKLQDMKMQTRTTCYGFKAINLRQLRTNFAPKTWQHTEKSKSCSSYS